MKRAITAITLGVALISTLSLKDANAFLDLNLESSVISGSNTLYTYTVSLTPGFNLDANSNLELFDFFGLNNAPVFTVAPGVTFSGFTVSVQNSGPLSPPFGVVDNAGVPNIFLDSNGAFTGPAAGSGASSVLLGRFTASSPFGVTGAASNPFQSNTRNQTGNTPAGSNSFILGPGQDRVLVPEAGTMALLATGLLGMVGVGLRRRMAK